MMSIRSPFFLLIVSLLLFLVLVPFSVQADAPLNRTTDIRQGAITPGGPIQPGKPKLPVTPTPAELTPKLIVVRQYTVPSQLRALEPFDLNLEIQNVGSWPATDYWVGNQACFTATESRFVSDDLCIKPIPLVDINEIVTVQFRLRWIAGQQSNAATTKIQIGITDNREKITEAKSIDIELYFLPPIPTIANPTVEFVYDLDKPDILVADTWTAKPRSTVEELLTRVPLMIFQSPLIKNGEGGP